MSTEGREDRFRQLEESYDKYTVYDQHYEKIGKVDDLFVDGNDEPEYIGVKMGFLGRKSTLIPMEIARVNDKRELIEIASDKDAIENAPTFSSDKDINSDYESKVHQHFGLERPGAWNDRSGYGDYYDSHEESQHREDPVGAVDTEYGERREESPERSTQSTSSSEHGRSDLDLPIGGSEHEDSRDRPEHDDSSRDSSVTFGGPDDDSPTGESGRDEDRERNSSGIRVYKRARR